MTTFPTLTAKPHIVMPTEDENPALSSETVNGMVITRPRFTRIKSKWQVTYPYITDLELTSLKVFYRSVLGGSGNFFWDDEFGNTYDVRFLSVLSHSSITDLVSTVSFQVGEV